MGNGTEESIWHAKNEGPSPSKRRKEGGGSRSQLSKDGRELHCIRLAMHGKEAVEGRQIRKATQEAGAGRGEGEWKRQDMRE